MESLFFSRVRSIPELYSRGGCVEPYSYGKKLWPVMEGRLATKLTLQPFKEERPKEIPKSLLANEWRDDFCPSS